MHHLSFFLPLNYNCLPIWKLFLQFADGYGILHDSEGFCEKTTLSFYIFHVRTFLWFILNRTEDPKSIRRIGVTVNYIYTSSKFQFFSNISADKACNVYHFIHTKHAHVVHLREGFSGYIFLFCMVNVLTMLGLPTCFNDDYAGGY